MNRIGICIQESFKINKSMSDTQHLSSDPNTAQTPNINLEQKVMIHTQLNHHHCVPWGKTLPNNQKNLESPTFSLLPPDRIPFSSANHLIPKTGYHMSDYHSF